MSTLPFSASLRASSSMAAVGQNRSTRSHVGGEWVNSRHPKRSQKADHGPRFFPYKESTGHILLKTLPHLTICRPFLFLRTPSSCWRPVGNEGTNPGVGPPARDGVSWGHSISHSLPIAPAREWLVVSGSMCFLSMDGFFQTLCLATSGNHFGS